MQKCKKLVNNHQMDREKNTLTNYRNKVERENRTESKDHQFHLKRYKTSLKKSYHFLLIIAPER